MKYAVPSNMPTSVDGLGRKFGEFWRVGEGGKTLGNRVRSRYLLHYLCLIILYSKTLGTLRYEIDRFDTVLCRESKRLIVSHEHGRAFGPRKPMLFNS